MRFRDILRAKLLVIGLPLMGAALVLSGDPCRAGGKKPSQFNNADSRYPIIARWRLGIIDRNGKVVVRPQLQSASVFDNGYSVIEQQGRRKLVDIRGNVVLDPDDYRPLYPPGDEGLVMAVNDDNRYGYVKLNGEVIVPFRYKGTRWFSEGLAAVREDAKWGYVDVQGNVVVDFKYDLALPFKSSRAAVRRNQKWGYIDRQGREVIPLKYSWAGCFSEGLADVSDGETRHYIDPEGKRVIEGPFRAAREFHEGLAAVSPIGEKRYGFIRKDGSTAIRPQFDSADDFSEGLCAVIASPDENSPIGSLLDRIGVERRDRVGYIDTAGRFVITFDPDLVDGVGVKIGGRSWHTFRKGLAWVTTEEKQGYINHAGDWVWSHPKDTAAQLDEVILEDAAASDDPRERLWAAIKSGDVKKTETVLSRHPNMARRRLAGEPLIHTAAESGKVAIVKLLIEHGADVNHRNRSFKQTPLHALASSTHADAPQLAKLLIDAGADPDARSYDGDTPLHDVAFSERPGSLKLAEYLLSVGADCDARNHAKETPLYNAAAQVHPEMVELLLHHDADPMAKDREGRTPLSMIKSSLRKLNSNDRLYESKRDRYQKVVDLLEGADRKQGDGEEE